MGSSLAGRSILVVEDEPLIAMDLAQIFREAGARVVVATSLPTALDAVKNGALSAAILDHALGDDDSASVRAHLVALGIPFAIYSAYPKPDGAGDYVHLNKPALPADLLAAVEGLLARSQADASTAS